jgi:DNA-binding Xre family transcriptional regulator
VPNLRALEISQSVASRGSGVSFASINRRCTNATRRVDLDVIDQICGAFRLKPGELFEFLPGQKGEAGVIHGAGGITVFKTLLPPPPASRCLMLIWAAYRIASPLRCR